LASFGVKKTFDAILWENPKNCFQIYRFQMSLCHYCISIIIPQFESLSREDLVNLVRKLLASQNEGHKQLETTKTEAEQHSNFSKQAEVYFAFLGIILKHFDIQIILLGIFPTNCPIGTGECGSSCRIGPKGG
jgi:hypothetical protein